MVRKADSGWRDQLLGERHRGWGFEAPAPGMVLPMIEYDRGSAVGLISYHRRGNNLPWGVDAVGAHTAFAHVHSNRDGSQLPFMTAIYDVDTWAMRVFAHNDAARLLVGHGWSEMTEHQFAVTLYTMRNRFVPDLSRYGVAWNDYGWAESPSFITPDDEPWPGAEWSSRRRNYEPMVPVPFRDRAPCMDVDFAVVDCDQRLALVADYKRAGAAGRLDFNSNLKALASLRGSTDHLVPAFLAEYAPVGDEWPMRVTPLNLSARRLLSYTFGATGAGTMQLAEAIAGDGHIPMTETQWVDVLRVARDT